MTQKRTLSPMQDIAATPTENVWVQANAGTGKTSVLVQRLLRILFRADDLDKSGILCLTYTNAAAGEMRNRILAALRTWAMSSDAELRELLDGVAENAPVTDADLAHARQIFFKYIDAPDILKIKTIHGFCEEILRRFPTEAGVSPSWSLISDAAQRVLLQDAFDRLINSSLRNTSGNAKTVDAFTHLVGRVSENYIDELLGVLSGQYRHFFGINDIDKYREYFIDTTKYFLDLDSPVQTEFDPQKLQKIIDLTESEIKSSKKPAAYLTKIFNLTKQYIDTTIDFSEYKTVYLRADDGKIANVAKKEYLADEQERVYQIAQRHANQTIFDDTIALFDLSAAFTKTYRELKSAQNVLDFEDLILYVRRLFSTPGTMGWILSQLNVQLSHILVDEAQDTAPAQWDILRALAGDFFTDGNTADAPHSLFVVGDTKQSIYGFQGADPRAFAASRDDIAAHIEQNMRTIREIPLAQSFRSLSPILKTVDKFFGDETIIAETGFSNNEHKCFRNAPGGLVELHKLTSRANDEIDTNEYICAIADKIKSLIVDDGFAAYDIMVLVQNRNPMASPLVGELKRRNIDVAGSDRIILPRFSAVRDLVNLVRFCINPADDYSLCCVLKSPLYRLTERDIFNICRARIDADSARRRNDKNAPRITIMETLGDIRPDIHADLGQIIAMSQTMAPYSFFSYILSHNNTRASIMAALGAQALDPLEEFMTICLSYERTQPGTMRHFLKWFITGNSEIKRDMDASSGVRVVTVHGSKGLESPIVFLIDTVRTPSADSTTPISDELLPAKYKKRPADWPCPWLWSPRASTSQRRAEIASAAARTQLAEYYRLLYVAMTRARDRLYIYGYTPHKNAPELSWHTQLWRVLSASQNTDEITTTIRITDDE